MTYKVKCQQQKAEDNIFNITFSDTYTNNQQLCVK